MDLRINTTVLTKVLFARVEN